MGFFHELGSFIGEVSSIKDDALQVTDDIKSTIADTTQAVKGLKDEAAATLSTTAQNIQDDIGGAVQDVKKDLESL
jgi:uncharacterized protein YoxC